MFIIFSLFLCNNLDPLKIVLMLHRFICGNNKKRLVGGWRDGFRALVVFPEDPDLIFSTHMPAVTPVPEDPIP